MKGRLGRIAKDALRTTLHRAGYRISRCDAPDHLEPLLYSLMQQQEKLFFVQIGANDGRSFDPIHHFLTLNCDRVGGLAVEPLGDFFAELKRTYAKYPGIVPVNVAIHNTERQMVLHRVDPRRAREAKSFTKGIGSFNKDHHRLTKVPDDMMIAETVQCVPLGELLSRYQVSQVDLLVIDTEGYDAEILRGLDLAGIAPRIIRFEHAVPYQVMSRDEFKDICDRLHRHGYELIIESNDGIAYRRNLFLDH